MVNAGATPQGNQVLAQWKDAANDQVLVNPMAMTDGKVTAALLEMALAFTTQAQAIMDQANNEVVPRDNEYTSSIAMLLRDITRMNPPMFFGSIVGEDPQDLLDGVHKILFSMGVSTTEKAEFAAYQLQDVDQTWYNQWKDSRALGGGPVTWETFKKAFLDRFFPREKREDKVEEFINLCQGGISVKEYFFKFNNMSKICFLFGLE